MANKYHGRIGFVKYKEDTPGNWTDTVVERSYYGDIIQNRAFFNTSDKINDDMNITNKISIVANSFAIENLQWMKYIEWLGVLWKITSIEPSLPRIILTIGGVYNGEQA